MLKSRFIYNSKYHKKQAFTVPTRRAQQCLSPCIAVPCFLFDNQYTAKQISAESKSSSTERRLKQQLAAPFPVSRAESIPAFFKAVAERIRAVAVARENKAPAVRDDIIDHLIGRIRRAAVSTRDRARIYLEYQPLRQQSVGSALPCAAISRR